ncbi:MAG: acyl-CoA dehydrogenase family protein [Acidimicrobiaceae bacterium]|nr:acyl-CoA dehydrogenase family protein [Acidimicrobiia bacterium]MCY4495322.1 acyl-CoA dehydrogenase family protein [Acidimicrobiaceae bacterium]
MDFRLSDEEQAISDLTAQILGDKSTHERLCALTADDDRIDAEAWAALAQSGVLGAAVPTEYGGLGLGFLATAMALQQVGATASPVPLLSTAVMGAMPIAEFGTAEQRARCLPAIAEGSLIVAAALYEEGAPAAEPEVVALTDGDDYRIEGVKPMVADGLDAGLILVPARLDDGSCGVFLVPSDSEGLSATRVEVTTGRPQGRLEFSAVVVPGDALLGGVSAASSGAEIVDWIELRANCAMCLMMAGAARSSIELAAEYTKQRYQFDRPVATFQAVSNRAGDSYIDTNAITLTAWQAAWRIDCGLPARDAVSIARWWAAEGGFRVVHAAVHVHGGVGVDRDYPLHRYFLLARQLELTLGNGEEHLATLGQSIAAR